VAERLVERVVGELGHRGQDRERDILADHRGRLQERLLGLGEVPDPAQQDALHRVGNRQVAGQAAAVLDGQGELLQEEGIAFRAAQDHLYDRPRQRHCGQHRARHGQAILVR